MDEIVRLIEAEIPRLRRYARALLRDQDRADDLVQDTLLRGFDKVHLFRSGDLRAWLFTIMHNQYVNSVRRSVRQGEAIVVEKVHLSAPAPQLPQLELRELERAIARLSAEQRETLLLVTLEGLKYEEVAQVCDVPTGTVRSRLSRAREELRRMMEGTIARQGSQPFTPRSEGAPFIVEPVKDAKPTN
jgi:RNA polymerase sigma-70 factor (ECF subfamily)